MQCVCCVCSDSHRLHPKLDPHPYCHSIIWPSSKFASLTFQTFNFKTFKLSPFQLSGWKFGLTVCQFYLTVDYTASTASIFNLFILSLDRFVVQSASHSLKIVLSPKKCASRNILLICATKKIRLLGPPEKKIFLYVAITKKTLLSSVSCWQFLNVPYQL